MNTKIILSKAEALLILAHSDTKRCQGGTYLLRVLSNYATIGRDAGSKTIKRDNPRISVRASELKTELPMRDFEAATVNEHPDPLKQVWLWIVQNRGTLEPAGIIERIYSYPMVTITKEEDQSINKAGFRDNGSPECRFKAAGIELSDGRELKALKT